MLARQVAEVLSAAGAFTEAAVVLEKATPRGPDEAGLHDQRDVERVRAPVRLAGNELVVDGEGVETSPEQRVRVEDLRDEVVDEEVRAGRPAPGRQRAAPGAVRRSRRLRPHLSGGGAHLCLVDRAADVAPVLRDFLG